MKKLFLVAGLVFVFLVALCVISIVNAQEITACKSNKNGTLLVVSDCNDCKKGASCISCNIEGPPGTEGVVWEDGLNCWYLNEDGICNLLTEDIDENGDCDALDCQGPGGLPGPPGPSGGGGCLGIFDGFDKFFGHPLDGYLVFYPDVPAI